MRDKKFLIINMILNILIIAMGIILFNNPAFGLLDPVYYFSIYFFTLTFLSLIAYFICRRRDNEENLILAVISVITGTYLFLSKGSMDSNYLAMSIIIFTTLFASYKGYAIYRYKDNDSYKWFLELVNTFVIVLIGFLTVINLFNEVSVQTLIFGFYFISLGTIDLLEILIYTFLKSTYFKTIYKKISKEEK
ncbi:MAG: DUF308 domain-containing protein [Bacilli bacterium]